MAEITRFPLLRHLRAEPEPPRAALPRRPAGAQRTRPGVLVPARSTRGDRRGPGRRSRAALPVPRAHRATSRTSPSRASSPAASIDPETLAAPRRLLDRPCHGTLARAARSSSSPRSSASPAQQFAWAWVAAHDVRTILERRRRRGARARACRPGAERGAGEHGPRRSSAVRGRPASPRPPSWRRRCRRPPREAIQQNADQATFQRRALAVEKERAIQENELQNQIELATPRGASSIGQRGAERPPARARGGRGQAHRGRGRGRPRAPAGRHRGRRGARRSDRPGRLDRGGREGTRAGRSRTHAHLRAVLEPQVLLGLAARELAGKLQKIEHLTVTPDMLGQLVGELLRAGGGLLGTRRASGEGLSDGHHQGPAGRPGDAPHGVREPARAPRHARAGRASSCARAASRSRRSRSRHARFAATLAARARPRSPPDWRRARVDRDDLDRFLFAPDDVVVVLGQDGLVANVAKYLAASPCSGINPEPERFEGVLCPHHAADLADLLAGCATGRALPHRAAHHGRGAAARTARSCWR